MAYKKGGPLINRNALFLIVSKALLWLVVILGWPVMKIMYGFKVSGRKNLEAAVILPRSLRNMRVSPCILVSNHAVPLDPLLHGEAILPRFTYFTLLEETVLTPVLGTFVRLLGGIPVPQDQDRLGDIEKAVGIALRGRRLIHFYPEGECFLLNQEIKPFKAGAFYYAIKFGVPIVPVVTVIKARPARQTARHRAAGSFRTVTGSLTAAAFRGAKKAPRITAHIHILPPMVPPASTGRASSDLHNAIQFSRSVRTEMQKAIDAEGGDKSLYLGPMPRIRGVNDRNRE